MPLPAGCINMPRSHTGLQKTSLWCASNSVMTSKTVFSTILNHVVTITFDFCPYSLMWHALDHFQKC